VFAVGDYLTEYSNEITISVPSNTGSSALLTPDAVTVRRDGPQATVPRSLR
jgi:hypothetical protein